MKRNGQIASVCQRRRQSHIRQPIYSPHSLLLPSFSSVSASLPSAPPTGATPSATGSLPPTAWSNNLCYAITSLRKIDILQRRRQREAVETTVLYTSSAAARRSCPLISRPPSTATTTPHSVGGHGSCAPLLHLLPAICICMCMYMEIWAYVYISHLSTACESFQSLVLITKGTLH